MMTYDEPMAMTRRILTQGAHNARDAGGYPTQDGQWMRRDWIFRSAALDALTQEDLDQFNQLGIRTVIDLRDKREADAAPDRFDENKVRYLRIPIFEDRLFERDLDNFPTLLGQYQIIMDEHVHQLIAVLQVMAESADRPMLIHCTAGKDRTGLIIALLHAIVGLADDTILADYGASQSILGTQFEDSVRALYARAALPARILGASPRHAPPTYLQQTLDTIRSQHGSVSHFLTQSGLDAAAQERLRTALRMDHPEPATP